MTNRLRYIFMNSYVVLPPPLNHLSAACYDSHPKNVQLGKKSRHSNMSHHDGTANNIFSLSNFIHNIMVSIF